VRRPDECAGPATLGLYVAPRTIHEGLDRCINFTEDAWDYDEGAAKCANERR
jgi:hypothetical protein